MGEKYSPTCDRRDFLKKVCFTAFGVGAVGTGLLSATEALAGLGKGPRISPASSYGKCSEIKQYVELKDLFKKYTMYACFWGKSAFHKDSKPDPRNNYNTLIFDFKDDNILIKAEGEKQNLLFSQAIVKPRKKNWVDINDMSQLKDVVLHLRYHNPLLQVRAITVYDEDSEKREWVGASYSVARMLPMEWKVKGGKKILTFRPVTPEVLEQGGTDSSAGAAGDGKGVNATGQSGKGGGPGSTTLLKWLIENFA